MDKAEVLLVYGKKIPSVNSIYGVNKYKKCLYLSAEAKKYKASLQTQLDKSIEDKSVYFTKGNDTYYKLSINFIISKNMYRRDLTNFVKLTEDFIFPYFNLNDANNIETHLYKSFNKNAKNEYIHLSLEESKLNPHNACNINVEDNLLDCNIYSKKIPSVNSMYGVNRKTGGKYLMKEPKEFKESFKDSLGKLEVNPELFSKKDDYNLSMNFAINNFNSRDLTNMIKISEDSLFEYIDVNDSRNVEGHFYKTHLSQGFKEEITTINLSKSGLDTTFYDAKDR